MPAATTFEVTLLLSASAGLSSVAPTVSIATYYSAAQLVDYYTSAAFTPAALPVTPLETLSAFTIESPQVLARAPTAGYFGPLILHIKNTLASTVSSGYYLIVTLTSDFYPYGNTNNLPLRC